ncbi:MAG: hypothetical protein AAGJ54_07295 [Planctomycetota bacterium]
MKATKAALFGGTLLSAGLASGQQLEFADNGFAPSSYSFAYAYVSDTDYVYARDGSYDPSVLPADQSAIAGGWSASGEVSATTMLAQADAGAETGAYVAANGRAYAYVTQSQDTDVILFWDFSDEQPGLAPENSFITIFDFAAGDVIFEINTGSVATGPVSGFDTVTLLAGVPYGITLSADIFGPAGVNGSASAGLQVVPAPATAIMALAGLGTAVRRRR